MMKKRLLLILITVLILTVGIITGCGNKDEKEIKQVLNSYLEAIRENNFDEAMSYISQLSKKNSNQKLVKEHWEIVQNSIEIKQAKVTDRIKVFENKYAVALVDRKEINKINNQTLDITADYYLVKENGTWKIIRINEIFFTIESAIKDKKLYIAKDLAKTAVEISPYTVFAYYTLARIYHKEKRYSNVSQTVEKGVEVAKTLLKNDLVTNMGVYHELLAEMYILDLKLTTANEELEKAFEEYRKLGYTQKLSYIKDRMIYVKSIKYLDREKEEDK